MNKKHLLGLMILTFATLLVNPTKAQDFSDIESSFFQEASTIGGYGEMHYNQSIDSDGNSSAVLDFHRFIIFYSHAWTENWSFKSEVEIEHNYVKNGQGELELEQAFVDYHHSDSFGFQVGVLLPSVGLLNENHDPPLFFGVERPNYSKYIIPTTWFGNGAAIYGSVRGFDYRVVLMEGLDGTKFSPSSGIRNGRQKGYKSEATHPLLNLRLETRQIHGLFVGGSYSTMQAADTLNGNNIINPTSLMEVHAQYTAGDMHVITEFGQINYGEPEAVSNVSSARGYYIDLGYDLRSVLALKGQLIPWFRYSDVNTAASTDGSDENLVSDHHTTEWLVGLQFKPISDVVFKLDYGKCNQILLYLYTVLVSFLF